MGCGEADGPRSRRATIQACDAGSATTEGPAEWSSSVGAGETAIGVPTGPPVPSSRCARTANGRSTEDSCDSHTARYSPRDGS